MYQCGDCEIAHTAISLVILANTIHGLDFIDSGGQTQARQQISNSCAYITVRQARRELLIDDKLNKFFDSKKEYLIQCQVTLPGMLHGPRNL